LAAGRALLTSALTTPICLAGSAVAIPNDGNSRIAVPGARVQAGATTVLYYTYPDLGDPNSGKSCTLNFYAVVLQPGLDSATPKTLASGVCGFMGARASLLPNGDLLILVHDHLERWRSGKRLSSESFATVEATRGLGVDTSNGGQFFDLAATGDSVIAVPRAGNKQQRSSDFGAQVIGLNADGKLRWKLDLDVPGERLTIMGVWAGTDGGALLHVDSIPSDNSTIATEDRLYPIISAGKLMPPVVIAKDKQLDMQSLSALKPEDMSRFGELMQNNYMEGIKKLNVFARPGGGFDVLLQRTSGADGREGHYLYQIARGGQIEAESRLTDRIEGHGLEYWSDFYIDGEQMVLLSQVNASQSGVQSRRTKYGQNAVSRMKLSGGQPETRLIPLDRRYLEAAMNAADEELQYLDDRPGGDPVLLSRLGSIPLAVSIGYLNRRFAVRFDEAGDDLISWDEAYEERQAGLAKEAARQQRKLDREASKQQFNADMAAVVDMTPEEYAALSNRERKTAMIKSGDMDAMMAAVAKQAEMMKQAMAAGGQAQNMASGDTNTQMAAAMKQAMAAMAAAGMDPSALGGAQTPVSAPPANRAPPPENVLRVDASQRGFVEFKHPDGAPVTLLISDNKSSEELLRKTYNDGEIYEYVDFSRFNRPLVRIRVQYLDAGGTALKNLTPGVAP
jgi:hypothetical protein